MKEKRFDEDKTRENLSFLHHTLVFRGFSPGSPFRPVLRPPKAVFEDLWWTLGRNRVDSDEPMGMISIAVCMLRGYQGQFSDVTRRCLIFIRHLGGS
jgi:hypothetical protein